MGLRSPDQIILFDFMFVFLLGLFGATTGIAGGANQLQSFQSIPTPNLAPLPKESTCAIWDYLCNSSKDIVRATAYIGWAIINLPVIGIYFLIVVISFADIVLGTAFSPQFSANGIPIIGFFFIALQSFVAYDVLKGLFRGSSTGL